MDKEELKDKVKGMEDLSEELRNQIMISNSECQEVQDEFGHMQGKV